VCVHWCLILELTAKIYVKSGSVDIDHSSPRTKVKNARSFFSMLQSTEMVPTIRYLIMSHFLHQSILMFYFL
jgi:hypothetical protein